MAAIRFTHKERDEITIKIADYIILTGSSTRKTAVEFGLSNVTILTLMNKVLPNLDMQKYLKVQEILQRNKPKTINDEEVRNRVLESAELIKQGLTVGEIAKQKNLSVHIIYEDLQTRLQRISQDLYEEIKDIEMQNSLNNLKSNK